MSKFIRIFILFLITMSLLGCKKIPNEERILHEVEQHVEKMTLREKIAQMLIVYNRSSDFSEEYLQELKENQVGGFILFDDNISTYQDTKELIYSMYELSNLPMFIAIDQEGGGVQRLNSIKDKKATNIPDMKVLGDKNDVNLSYAIGTIIGEETRSLGINMVFAPVLDIGNYKTSPLKKRIISSNSQIVADNGIKIAEGIKDSGVIPVYKHFPGIGDTKTDSHKDLPVINKTREELYAKELIPFKNAIENNYYKAEMIMIGHANYPKISNNELPSSLSKEIIGDLLRDELGYEGVVITDALNMVSLTKEYSEEEIFTYGINATVDIFLMPSKVKETIDLIEKLVNSGKIMEENINNSVKRILLLKKKYLENFTSLDELYFGSTEHKDIVKNIK